MAFGLQDFIFFDFTQLADNAIGRHDQYIRIGIDCDWYDPINIDTISFGLYIPGNLLWEFNLSAEVIFSPDFIRNILLILVLFLT